MRNKLTIKPEFVVDKKGKRKAVIIDYRDYIELLEDLEDLRDVTVRENEPSRLFSNYHKERIKKK